MALNDSMEILLKYPLINLSKTKKHVIYRGCIFVNDKDYEIHIKQTVGNPSKFELIKTLDLDPFETELDLFKLNLKSIVPVLDFIKATIEQKTANDRLQNHTHIYQKVLNEYYEFTRFFINCKACDISKDLTSISLMKLDEEIREHSLKISIDYNETDDIFSIAFCDIPEHTQNENLFKKFNSLVTLYNQFQTTIDLLQPFWELMETFDSNCSILDPERPKRGDKYRRIWLENNLSIVITVDPFNVYATPDIKFLGPEKLVEGLRLKVNTNFINWKNNTDTFQEILNLLELENFPSKNNALDSNSSILKDEGECSICFSYRLDDQLPEIICKNKSCQNFYHTQCLYEWLIALNVKWFFSEITGQCPNCEKSISCPIPVHIQNKS